MSLAKLEKKINDLKEVSIDDRIELMGEIEAQEDRVAALRDVLGDIPDAAAPEGKQDPRDAFVDGLIAAAGDDKSNNGNGRTVNVR